MKKIYKIALWMCLAWTWVSCEKYEPDLFDESANGAYFDYEYAADFNKTLNFGEYIVGDPDTPYICIPWNTACPSFCTTRCDGMR